MSIYAKPTQITPQAFDDEPIGKANIAKQRRLGGYVSPRRTALLFEPDEAARVAESMIPIRMDDPVLVARVGDGEAQVRVWDLGEPITGAVSVVWAVAVAEDRLDDVWGMITRFAGQDARDFCCDVIVPDALGTRRVELVELMRRIVRRLTQP